MNKSELVSSVADRSRVTKREVEAVLEAFFDTVRSEVKSDSSVAWPNFGKFSQSSRAAREGRNPQTGATVKIKASKGVKFSSSAGLKEFMNGKKKR